VTLGLSKGITFDMMNGPARGVVTTPADRFTTTTLLGGMAMPHEPTSARSSRQSRDGNPNWRGGRSLASNGYVLIRVGTGHPLADVRGYAYEHRLVASRMLARWLEPSEQVHHRNGDKSDNRPENLEVMATVAEHRAHHRCPDSLLRLPGEGNPPMSCACGCGETFPRFDDYGRPRKFISGHNLHPPTSRGE
jgi:hypothetical protein